MLCLVKVWEQMLVLGTGNWRQLPLRGERWRAAVAERPWGDLFNTLLCQTSSRERTRVFFLKTQLVHVCTS